MSTFAHLSEAANRNRVCNNYAINHRRGVCSSLRSQEATNTDRILAMSDGESSSKPTAANDDKPNASDDSSQLSQLLNDALKDFSDEPQPTSGSALPVGDNSEIDENLPDCLTQEMAQKTAADFQNMLKQLASVQQAAIDKDGGVGASSAPHADDDQAKAFLDNLNKLTEKAGNVAGAGTEDDFVKKMQEFQDEGFQNDLMPFMHGLMSSLMSKEMMYPSLKELVDKYPQWLIDNESSTAAEELARYRQQLQIMRTLVGLYDLESEADSVDVKAQRFDQIIMNMQQELVGELPAGWGFDAGTGMPHVTDSAAAAENPQCSVM